MPLLKGTVHIYDERRGKGDKAKWITRQVSKDIPFLPDEPSLYAIDQPKKMEILYKLSLQVVDEIALTILSDAFPCYICGKPSERSYCKIEHAMFPRGRDRGAGVIPYDFHQFRVPTCSGTGSPCYNKTVKWLDNNGYTEKIADEAFGTDADRIAAIDLCRYCKTSTMNVKRDFKRCSRCKKATYCSVECQKSDWNDHKLACAPKQ